VNPAKEAFSVYICRFSTAPVLALEFQPDANLRGTKTILYADDHDSIREMAGQSLLNLGYHVLAADDGEQALRLCERETPALAILDVVMPRLGGRATAAKLRTRFPELPILFTSGYSEYCDSSVSQIPGPNYLQKPYSPTSPGRAIREILDNSATVFVDQFACVPRGQRTVFLVDTRTLQC
jgi:two-component system cell cycle sensor histidine kinase/response regulator CckA